MNPDLLSTGKIGDLELSNRMVMAPVSRNRATPEGLPTALMAEHDGQRASAGLIITESAPVSQQGLQWAVSNEGYARTAKTHATPPQGGSEPKPTDASA
ncbi:hypothetical protein [uncultured Roseobacter sp.]|uniref:oxidoreductase n=1 Tax=uncultured Roseobacter sp. TaxID=114847 RepID=UPI00261DAD78|nr:hypothetical protein [uncultured Roseobacter sp.]